MEEPASIATLPMGRRADSECLKCTCKKSMTRCKYSCEII